MTTLLMLIRSTMAPSFHGQVEGKCVGVIRYSGYANRQNVQQKLGELVALLRKVCVCVCVPHLGGQHRCVHALMCSVCWVGDPRVLTRRHMHTCTHRIACWVRRTLRRATGSFAGE